jgi:hypothetical protein
VKQKIRAFLNEINQELSAETSTEDVLRIQVQAYFVTTPKDSDHS